MADPESRLAHAVLAQNLKVRRGETVLIESWTHSLPYARAFVAEARRLGARPTVLYEDEEAWWDAVDSRRLASFATLSRTEAAALSAADVYIYFWGPEDRPRAERLPDDVQEKVTGYNPEWYRRARKAGLRGCRMTLGQATDPVAGAFGLKGPQWRRRLMEAGSVDGRRMALRGARVARAIRDGAEMRIRHPNGTDVRLRLSGAHPRVDAGIVDRAAMKRPFGMLASNPSGQVVVGLDDCEAEGTLVSNRPVFMGPNTFSGIRWVFSQGRLVEHSCRTGGKVFQKQFDSAPEGRDRAGYLSIGLNPKARELAPCEDTEEGSVLMGIGGNGFAGGRIRIPFQAFALVGEPSIEVDGRTIAHGGRVR
jgi:leucyl aminopeptidase (aminopeptidase T)